MIKLGLTPKLEAIAKACSDSVLVPLDTGCCAFAGDRGFLVPELTASATRGVGGNRGRKGKINSSQATAQLPRSRLTQVLLLVTE